MATYQKHWTKHLSRTAKITKQLGEYQDNLKNRLERLKQELARLEKEYDANEQHIRQFVLIDNTEEQIKEAKLKALSEMAYEEQVYSLM